MMKDQYQGWEVFYNKIAHNARNYPEIARDMQEIIGENQEILDIGIGTGLIVKELLKDNPQYRITGIDTSQPLLNIAKEYLPNSVELYNQDVATLDLPKTFSVAYSRGGAWTFINANSRNMLISHIFNQDKIQEGFKRVAAHLADNGLLIISFSNANTDKNAILDTDLIYQRSYRFYLEGQEQYLRIDCSVLPKGQPTRHFMLKLKVLEFEVVQKMLENAGFLIESVFKDSFYVFKKRRA